MKLSIVGAGAVGSALAFIAAGKGVAHQIVIHDVNVKLANAQALDIEHGNSFYPSTEVIGTDDIEAVRDSDIIVVTAGARQNEGETRIELASRSIDIIKKIIPPLVNVSPNAKFILVSNPVDIVTFVAQKISGISYQQMFGSGTWLDSSRLRSKLATFTGVSAKNVHAYIVGEHGDSEIPLWSSATIGNVRIDEWRAFEGYPQLTAKIRDEIYSDVVNAAYKVIGGKGATNYAVAFAVLDIITAIAKDERRIMPISTLIGKNGDIEIDDIDDVCLSLPRIIANSGVIGCLNTSLSIDELCGLKNSAKVLRKTLKEHGF